MAPADQQKNQRTCSSDQAKLLTLHFKLRQGKTRRTPGEISRRRRSHQCRRSDRNRDEREKSTRRRCPACDPRSCCRRDCSRRGCCSSRALKCLDKLKLDMAMKPSVFTSSVGSFCSCDSHCQQLRQARQPDCREDLRRQKANFGYNGLTDEFTDLVKAGVIDPVLVTKSALDQCSFVAGCS